MKGMWQSKRSLKRQRDFLASRCAAVEANLARLVEAAEVAKELLEECSGDYNHPSFTDRRGTGTRISAGLKRLRRVLREIKGKRDA